MGELLLEKGCAVLINVCVCTARETAVQRHHLKKVGSHFRNIVVITHVRIIIIMAMTVWSMAGELLLELSTDDEDSDILEENEVWSRQTTRAKKILADSRGLSVDQVEIVKIDSKDVHAIFKIRPPKMCFEPIMMPEEEGEEEIITPPPPPPPSSYDCDPEALVYALLSLVWHQVDIDDTLPFSFVSSNGLSLSAVYGEAMYWLGGAGVFLTVTVGNYGKWNTMIQTGESNPVCDLRISTELCAATAVLLLQSPVGTVNGQQLMRLRVR